MTAFSKQAASDYDQRIPNLVPAYHLAQQIAAGHLAATLPEDACVLVAGAGTGNDLLALASAAPGWRFEVQDISEAMIDVARQKCAEAGHAARLTYHVARLEAAPNLSADAAVAFLVGHFIADDGARLAFLRALAQRLKLGAHLILFDYEAVSGTEESYLHWLWNRGHKREAARAVLKKIEGSWAPLSAERRNALLAEAGFKQPWVLLEALGYRLTLART